jgi:hypothetical protein
VDEEEMAEERLTLEIGLPVSNVLKKSEKEASSYLNRLEWLNSFKWLSSCRIT